MMCPFFSRKLIHTRDNWFCFKAIIIVSCMTRFLPPLLWKMLSVFEMSPTAQFQRKLNTCNCKAFNFNSVTMKFLLRVIRNKSTSMSHQNMKVITQFVWEVEDTVYNVIWVVNTELWAQMCRNKCLSYLKGVELMRAR